MSRFFIDRPIFAWVLAIVTMLLGVLAIRSLPIAQFPAIAPPQITITATYPGSSAQTLEDAVTQVIEQKMNGLDNLLYMASTSDSSGTATVTLTFSAGTNPDTAQVQVQNKLALATPLLPQEVQRQGVRVAKSARNFAAVVAFVSNDGSMNTADLSDYVASNIQDPLSRVPGVGDIQLFGSQYAMRIWLDPDRLNKFALTPLDVTNAVQAQNAQISAGQLGGTPAVKGQMFSATISAQTRLKSADEFGRILLRVNADGSRVTLADVARLELGAESYSLSTTYNGKPNAGFAIRLSAGANALETISAVRARLDELKPFFPKGVEVVYPLDTTPFVRISIIEVIKTLAEAIVLVFLVMYLFLQNFRATLIPTIAVPVVLLGTFGVLSALGFSINTLTMFGLVLAIGLLVDDAIVVVENVERVMAEEGLSPKEATKKSMTQITGALVGIALVLAAVFVPMAFYGGSVGVIYRQFSATIVSAMGLSVAVALILTPALCSTLLQPIAKGHHEEKKGFFGWFNRVFDRTSGRYQGFVGKMLQRTGRSFVVYGVIAAAMVVVFLRLPKGFLPDEDQGFMFAQVQLPAGSTQESTAKVLERMANYFLVNEKESVASVMAVNGFSFGGQGQNAGFAFVRLKDWDERKGRKNSAQAIAGRAMAAFSQYRDSMVFAFTPPAVFELGNATGFDFQLQDRGGIGHEKLIAARNQLLGMAAQNPNLMAVRPNGLEDAAEFKIEVDQEKASALGLSIADINTTLSSTWGVSYVNDFIDNGRVKRVYLQADAAFRMTPEDVARWYVRNQAGGMVPFSAFSTARWTTGSPKLERYNGVPSVEIQGMPGPGVSSGVAMQAMEDIVKQLPPGVGFEWTGLSYEERLAGSQALSLYMLSLVVVFLCLAALYESWSIPASVLLVVPLGVLGTVLGATLFHQFNDVYFQVALLTTIGLAAKNAILIVEFAKEEVEKGVAPIEAALTACRLRLRPILMTSFAFILGVMPLAIASGAGSGSQNAIGVSVIGGMLTGTFLAIFFVPVFFVAVLGLGRRKREVSNPAAVPALENAQHA
jgi:hydrophobe/amphiphile efflux-1 (HAE1) family protein